jgi:hypothetical protein
MLLATAYILLAGSYLEWCMILRSRYEVSCGLGFCHMCTYACFLQFAVLLQAPAAFTFKHLHNCRLGLWVRQHN